jgi:hypothetical protein
MVLQLGRGPAIASRGPGIRICTQLASSVHCCACPLQPGERGEGVAAVCIHHLGCEERVGGGGAQLHRIHGQDAGIEQKAAMHARAAGARCWEGVCGARSQVGRLRPVLPPGAADMVQVWADLGKVRGMWCSRQLQH